MWQSTRMIIAHQVGVGLVKKIYLLTTYYAPLSKDLPCSSKGKESVCNAGDLGLIPGLGRFPGEGNGSPFQYSGLENSTNYIVLLLLLSTSVMSDSVRPYRRQPTRLPHPWDSPGKNTGVGCHYLLQCMKVKSCSVVSDS